MNKTVIFAFIFGATVGAAITWRIATTKYEREIREELDRVYDDLSDYENPSDDSEDSSKAATNPINEKPSLEEYAKILKKTGYNDESVIEEGGDSDMNDGPYVISPDEYGENDYECESLTYYADGVLTDDWDNPIEDVEGLVGVESLEHFGDNDGDEDTVYVRNDQYKTDYEILRDNRNFSDVPKHNYTVGDE